MIFLERQTKVLASYLTKKYEIKKKSMEDFWALTGASFEVFAGEAIGLIGTNGSGKTTLSNIIAGVTTPTTGKVVINGKTSIVAINSGLKQELTGRENIKLKCLLSGMSKKAIDNVMEDVVAFAELDDFIDQPLKNYSSGMKSRLGFAISIHNNPDILIIDEALSVGDDTFYQKCVDKMFEFKQQGKTIFFVSHSLKQISSICDKVIWIQNGKMRQFDLTKTVTTAYKEYVDWYKELSKKEKSAHNKKQKNERQQFKIDDYYQIAVKENNQDNADELSELFTMEQNVNNTTLPTKLLAVGTILLLIAIAVFYVI